MSIVSVTAMVTARAELLKLIGMNLNVSERRKAPNCLVDGLSDELQKMPSNGTHMSFKAKRFPFIRNNQDRALSSIHQTAPFLSGPL